MRPSTYQAGFSLLEAAVVIAVLAVLASLLVIKVDHTMEDAQNTAARASMTAVRDAFVGAAVGRGYVDDMKFTPGFALTTIQVSDLLDPPDNPVAPNPNPLLFNPVTQRGWRGPYVQNPLPVRNPQSLHPGFYPAPGDKQFPQDLTFGERHFTSEYGSPGDRAVADPWGNPIVLQIPPASAIKDSTVELRWKYARLVSAGPNGVLETPLNDRLAGRKMNDGVEDRNDDLVLFLSRPDLYDEIDKP